MMHPHTELRPVDATVGLGVFATRLIPRGTIVWVRDELDMVVPAEVVQRLDPTRRQVMDRYAWEEHDGFVLCWDHGRFVNHSCEANSLGEGLDYEIAVRDIQPGEQITDDYRTLGAFTEAFPCHCGAASCMGTVRSGASPELRTRWEQLFSAAFQLMDEVEQPIAAYRVQRHTLPSVRTGPAAPVFRARMRL